MQHREEEIQKMKREYMEHEMSREQLERLKMVMDSAKNKNAKDRTRGIIQGFTSVAAMLAVGFWLLQGSVNNIAYAMEQLPVVVGKFVSVISFREYEYSDERHHADLEIPKLEVESTVEDAIVQEKLDEAATEINAEIQEIVDKIIAQFEAHIAEEAGYQEYVVKSEVLATTENYFTLKLMCYQGAGSGYQWNYYYTIDLSTRERMQLKDIFKDGADYITPISENIKEQMRAQMKKDSKVTYWLDDEIDEWNFKTITDETSFYINDKNHIVIAFDEGEVAPMYMGAVEFEIPSEVLENIRK